MSSSTIESNLPQWADAAAGYCDKLGYGVGPVLRWQVSRLCMDLVKLSPIAKAADIRKDVRTKFHNLGKSYLDIAPGKGVVRWYAASHTALYGLMRDVDITDLGGLAIYDIYFKAKLNRMGMRKLGQRGKQAVWGWQKLTASKEQIEDLTARLVGHIGRFKAGWTVSLEDCGMPHPPLPTKVARWAGRANMARGRSEDNTHDNLSPSFTVINYALGARNARKGTFVQIALMRRARYMRNHVKRLLANPEEAQRTVPDEVALSEGED